MWKFDFNLFLKALDDIQGLPEEPEDSKEGRLKKIILMVAGGQIDYGAFTFDEINEVYERACGYHSFYPENIFAQIEKSSAVFNAISRLPRRRDGRAFI